MPSEIGEMPDAILDQTQRHLTRYLLASAIMNTQSFNEK